MCLVDDVGTGDTWGSPRGVGDGGDMAESSWRDWGQESMGRVFLERMEMGR